MRPCLGLKIRFILKPPVRDSRLGSAKDENLINVDFVWIETILGVLKPRKEAVQRSQLPTTACVVGRSRARSKTDRATILGQQLAPPLCSGRFQSPTVRVWLVGTTSV